MSSTSTDFTNLTNAIKSANSMPAGTITWMADGTFDNTSTGNDIVKAGATLKARNKGKAIIKGQAVDLLGNQSSMEDFRLEYKVTDQTVVQLRGIEANLSGNICAFETPITSRQDWFVIRAKGCKIHHNETFGKKGLGNVILIGSGAAVVPDCQLYDNWIHDNTGGTGNGAEAIRLGSSEVANELFNTQIFNNKIERHKTSDTELITVKSSGNNIYGNEINDCDSNVTLRHGHNNKFIGNKVTNGGVRIYGKNNVVTDNKFYKNSRNQLRQFVIGNATVEEDVIGSNAEYSRVKNNVIERNEIINEGVAATDSIILFCLGYGGGALKPTGNSIKDNKVSASKGILYNTFDGASWSANTVSNNTAIASSTAKVGNIPNPITSLPPEPVEPILTVEQRIKSLEDRVTRLELTHA